MWQLSQSFAQLSLDSLTARVDLSRPDDGLFDLRPAGHPWDGARLCCVTRRSVPERAALLESYVRGNDLVATYAPDQACQVRPEIYYRALPAEAHEHHQGGLELIVSAQTSLLSVDPALRIESKMPASEVYLLRADERFAKLAANVEPIKIVDPPGVFLFRQTSADWSYVEMILPTDFVRAEISSDDATPRHVSLASMLFSESLEKGVIRRGRLRGLFLSRAGDEAAAARAYRQFVASPPPLTT